MLLPHALLTHQINTPLPGISTHQTHSYNPTTSPLLLFLSHYTDPKHFSPMKHLIAYIHHLHYHPCPNTFLQCNQQLLPVSLPTSIPSALQFGVSLVPAGLLQTLFLSSSIFLLHYTKLPYSLTHPYHSSPKTWSSCYHFLIFQSPGYVCLTVIFHIYTSLTFQSLPHIFQFLILLVIPRYIPVQEQSHNIYLIIHSIA